MDINSWANFFRYATLITLTLTFISGAGSWYFSAKLDSLNEQKILELEAKASNASKGKTYAYDYNGAMRESPKPGFINLKTDTPENTAFQEMVKLLQEGKSKEVIPIAEKQIENSPEWLTPYLFLGAVYADLGDKEKAVYNLEYVLKEAPGDPDYAKAKEILDKIE